MTDLDELERLLAKATEGPWRFGRGKSGLSVAAIAGKMKEVASSSWHSCSNHYPTERETVANFEVITALRNAAPAMIAELKALRRATAMSDKVLFPYPSGSIIQFRDDKSEERFLIDELVIQESNATSVYASYSILGHKNLNTEGLGSAWHDHDDIILLEYPSLSSWRMLLEARDQAE